jgi:hypothetical protein
MKIIVFVFIIICTSFCFAQSEANLDTVINSGWVIAYGQLLKKPYRLSMIGDTIYINGIRIEPPISKPISIPEGDDTSMQFTALGEIVWPRSDTFEVNCRSLWAEWMKNTNNDTAKVRRMLAAYIDTQQLIRIKNYSIGDYVDVI